MDDRFAVTWRTADRVLELRLAGFWVEAEMEAYAAELDRAIARAAGGSFDVIGDLGGLVPQSGSVVSLQAGLIARLAAAGMRRLVVVGAGALLTMQVRRAAADAIDPAFVDDIAAADHLLRQNR